MKEIRLKDLSEGDEVWCGGNSGFCTSSIEKIKKIEFLYDEKTGEKYKVIVIKGKRKFDSRDGRALNPPLAYFVEPFNSKK